MSLRRCATFLTSLTLVLAAAAGLAWAAPLPPQIHTVAGGGGCSGLMTSGGPCDGVSATSVPIGDARSVSAVPGGGFLYVDTLNDLVRQVSAKGTVTTVAGNSTTTDAADGTLAVNSGLDDPVSVAALPDGGFLVTEYAGSVVRLVSPGGPGVSTITTIAGVDGAPGFNGTSGAATSLELNYPTDAEPTGGGQVLIADMGNAVIREVSAQAPGASMSTVAGGGACDDTTLVCENMPAGAVALHEPVSVSPLASGTGGFLIAEADYGVSNTVRDVSPAGVFTTVAGVPGQTGGYSGDGGPATSALLNSPEQVVSTSDGGFLIADTHNERIRQVSPSGTITTVAGNGAATYTGDAGDATAASFQNPSGVAPYPVGVGELLVADENDGAIREVTAPPVSTISFGPASSQGRNGWYVFPVTAAVTTTEGAKINCEADPAEAPTLLAEIPTGCPLNSSTGQITTDGVHTVYAAAANSAGDDELPVSATVKLDQSVPTVTCTRKPTFKLGAKSATITARVSDAISGPVKPLVKGRAKTSRTGHHTLNLSGRSIAGAGGYASCGYTVVASSLSPTPKVTASFATKQASTIIRQLVVTDIPAKATVDLACTGRGCPFTKALNVTGKACGGRPCTTKRVVRTRRARLVLTRLFAHDRLTPDEKLTVTVAKANTISRVWIYSVRSGSAPSLRAACQDPSTGVVKACTAKKG